MPDTDSQFISNPAEKRLGAESQISFFNSKLSVRALLAALLTFTLCYVTIQQPEQFSEAFKITVTGVISFYFGQKNSNKSI